jgi:hypothetical protein
MIFIKFNWIIHMAPKIEITEELYNKLSELAVGFDTPENVISRLISDLVAVDKLTTPPGSSAIPKNPRSFVETAFQTFFKVTPRPFGQNAGKRFGASDNNNGVQWNISIDRESGETYLGVNLEGMKYKNWPITNLLLAETQDASLPSLADINAAEEITVKLTRDAWQAAARPSIKEKFIDGSGTNLKSMSPPLWEKMVKEALECLNPNVGYKGRGRIDVTLVKSGVKVTKEVSPHLTFHLLVWEKQPNTIEEAVQLISAAYDKLLPLYNWVEEKII